MGGVIELFLIMLIIASVAFAPLGYFIYKYTQKNGKPFGETDPDSEAPSFVNELAESAIHFVKSRIAKK
ncbi:hypothetical protein [Methylobacter psychrophilus]|jgi:hypothetical protein|uniref:hypothetical protein n=1 Tax=Methylobacter psychrophilus TaxID=96941 RepID=UPI0021D4B6C4|nr:hypothetical protein [Methylobacter psychrophilus]